MSAFPEAILIVLLVFVAVGSAVFAGIKLYLYAVTATKANARQESIKDWQHKQAFAELQTARKRLAAAQSGDPVAAVTRVTPESIVVPWDARCSHGKLPQRCDRSYCDNYRNWDNHQD